MAHTEKHSITSSSPFLRKLSVLMPGFLLCLVIGMAAKFVSEHHGGPTILYALLMGMALNYLSSEGRCVEGIQFAAKSILRFGIALLGARITIEQLMSLGMTPVVLVLIGVPATIGFSYLFGRWLKLGKSQSILAGASVGICGASAALAVSAVLPQDKDAEKNLIFTVICVTGLSTVAMILYPVIVSSLGLTAAESGIFLGATIHDVAQVVGAGYMISDSVGDVATFTKLLRVAMLVPVVLVISIIVARQNNQNSSASSKVSLPGFLIAFIVIVMINSTGYVPVEITSSLVDLSRWCLIVAMVGLGMKASFKELAAMGWRPIVLMITETIFLAVLIALGLFISR
ncbi:MAG: putative sulfate exporter family transporter [Gammaproteobacteria bacterium]|nr:putative sulfate exporter family transporter [Gammaproteobacteria bacterium]